MTDHPIAANFPIDKSVLDSIDIVDEQRNRYAPLEFRPFDLRNGGTLNPKLALQFCDNFRLNAKNILTTVKQVGDFPDYSSDTGRAEDVDSATLMEVSTIIGVPMILLKSTPNDISRKGNAGHWSLLLSQPDVNGNVEIYDPATEAGTKSVNFNDNKVEENSIGNAPALKLGARYNLQLHDNISSVGLLNQRFQVDSHNCGPMTLFNAIVRSNDLGYINDRNREFIASWLGVRLPEVPGINSLEN